MIWSVTRWADATSSSGLSQPPRQPAGEVHDRGQRLVDLVGELRRHALHRAQPQDVGELGLLLANPLLGSLALDHFHMQHLDRGGELLRALVDAPLELLVRALQGLLGTHPLGDVDREDDDTDDLPVLVTIRDLVGAHPALLARGGRQDLDDAQLRLAQSG